MDNEYVIRGPYADQLADMIAFVTRYVSGPGFTGFMTWTREQYCSNPEVQEEINEENARTNLANLSAVIGMLVQQGKADDN